MHRRTKLDSERITYKFDFARALEQVWNPGFPYSLTQYVRPSIPNGFEYECTDAGQTDQQEPDWPRQIGETIEDGTVTWTARDFGVNASDTIVTREIEVDTGLTLIGSSLDGSTRVTVTVEGGSKGQSYMVTCKVTTAAAEEYTEELLLTVS